ncbi:UNVERIFIED_CONTAM: hypothetical protein Slati_3664000 [Sesamum latifolium]|uniref:Uncharacterized protein n=1 Tax=Sesamum latifolium TaxID=2727402 RepID=A0AAW2U155_9LAMI
MATSKTVALMLVAVFATLSCVIAQGDLIPAPSPVTGAAALGFPVSAAVVASPLIFALLALLNY